MKRREFIQLALVGGVSALAVSDSIEEAVCQPNEEDLELLVELADRGIISEETVLEKFQEKETKKEILTPPKKVIVEVDEYKPRWNVDGSWDKAEDRGELIKHLSGPVHRKDPNHLITLSTDDLQRLHDTSHESTRNTSGFFRRKPKKVKRRRR